MADFAAVSDRDEVVDVDDWRAIPPTNIEAEQALLSALLARNSALDAVADTCRAEHFSLPVHGRIYEAIRDLSGSGTVANAVTLKGRFDHDPDLAKAGGAGYLANLQGSVITIVNAADYARTIRDLWVRRRLMSICEDGMHSATNPAHDAKAALADIQGDLDALDTGDRTRTMKSLSTALDEAISNAETVHKAGSAVIGIPTGLRDLDRVIGGFHDTDLVVIAGRPGMGKTSLATRFTEGAAAAGRRVLFFSLEMSSAQLAARMLAGATGIAAERQRTGPLQSQEIADLVDARGPLSAWLYDVDDASAADVTQLRRRIRQASRRRRVDIVIVDYLQLLIGAKAENRVQEISKITRDLKSMAKDFRIPVIAISQLSRKVEERDDKRPVLSDLRESGSIEQDADLVIFCYRDEYYLRQSEPKNPSQRETWERRCEEAHGLAELIIRKNRHGAERTITVHFDGPRTRFDDLYR
jgi:replicative DNA helicase